MFKYCVILFARLDHPQFRYLLRSWGQSLMDTEGQPPMESVCKVSSKSLTTFINSPSAYLLQRRPRIKGRETLLFASSSPTTTEFFHISQGASYLSLQFLQEEGHGLSMQIPRVGCQRSVDIGVSIHPNDTQVRVDPGVARDASNCHAWGRGESLCEHQVYNAITCIILLALILCLLEYSLSLFSFCIDHKVCWLNHCNNREGVAVTGQLPW